MTPPPAPAALPTAAFEYELPARRIAQRPLQRRDASRLLVVADDGALEDRAFIELPSLLRPGDLCVVNDTRVRAARLHGRCEGGGTVELLVLGRHDGDASTYLCLARPARRAYEGTCIRVRDDLVAHVITGASEHEGARVVRFVARDGDIDAAIERCGETPLPPYIYESLADRSRYQTVYAVGAADSAAAPTAGLHFTPAVIEALRSRDVAWASLRLDVGLATFAPIRTAEIGTHEMHEERYALPTGTAQAIKQARQRGGRVIAVGTTVVRVLETCADVDGVRPGQGATDLFITPGHRFRVVDGLLTNFHQPRSSLLVLLAAFTGMQRWRRAYEHALAHGYRFLSFGDCMLAWKAQEP